MIKKLIKSYSKLSLPLKASIWFVICNCIQKAAQIIITPIYTRLLTTSQYGEYTVFLSWVEFVVIFTSLDIFYSGYNVGMEKYKADRINYTSSMYGLCLTLTLICFIIVLTFSDFFAQIMGISIIHLILLMLYMFVYPVFKFWSAQKRYDYSYKILIIVTCISTLLTIIIGTLFAYTFVDKSTGIIVAKIISETIISIPLFIISVKNIRKLYNKLYWKHALKFNIPLIPHYISTMILNHSDKIMILNLCDASLAGIYSFAYSIANLITIVQNAINNALVPWLYGKLNKKQFSSISSIITIVVGIIAILNFSLIAIAPEVIKILGTTDYIDSRWIIPPVTFGIFLTAIYGIFVNIELFYGSNKVAAISSVLAAIINIVLNTIFIRSYGYLAAGYTTFVSYLVLTVIHCITTVIVCKKNDVQFNKLFNIRQILSIIFSFLILSIIIMIFYDKIIIRYVIIVVLIIFIFIFKDKFIEQIKIFIKKS